MKITAGQADRFCKAPDPKVRAVLVYGPDSGLVRERFDMLVKSVVADPGDPFLVSDIAPDTLKDDPARLGDEAAAMALTGGRRVVRIRDAGNTGAPVLKGFLDDPVGDALVVVSAGNLDAKSALRKAFEAAQTGAAVPCYQDEGAGLSMIVEGFLRDQGVSIDRDALDFVAANLGSDRGLTRMEVEKLALYAGQGGRIALEDARAVIGDAASQSMDDIVYAAADGDARTLDRALDAAWEEGTSPVAVLRMVSAHLMKLHLVAAERSRGKDIKAAMQSLRPPIFFKMAGRFEGQARRWPIEALDTALNLTLQAEADCKRTHFPDLAICGRTLHQIAALARRGAPKGKGGR